MVMHMTKHDADALSNSSRKSRDWLATLAAILIGLAPVIFALLTWETPYQQRPYRNIALPVLSIELWLPLLAILAGRQPLTRLISGSWTVPLAVVGLILLSFANAWLTAVSTDMALMFAVISLVHALASLGILALAIGQPDFAIRALAASCVGLAGYAVLVFVLYWTAPELTPETLTHSGAGASNVRHLSYYGSVGVALGLGLATFTPETRAKWLWLASATLSLAFIIWSGTRGGLFALAGMALLATTFFPDRGKLLRMWRYCAAIIPPACALSLIWVPDDPNYGLWRILSGSRMNDGADGFSSGRVGLWKDALRLFWDHPWIGHGQNQFKAISPLAIQSGVLQPHNFILQFLFDWGLIGTFLATYVIFAGLRSGRRAALAGDRIAAVALLGAVVLLAYGLIDGTLFHVYPVFAFSAFLTLAASRSERPA